MPETLKTQPASSTKKSAHNRSFLDVLNEHLTEISSATVKGFQGTGRADQKELKSAVLSFQYTFLSGVKVGLNEATPDSSSQVEEVELFQRVIRKQAEAL